MPSSKDQHSNHGFTLLEILLVVGIIAILAGYRNTDGSFTLSVGTRSCGHRLRAVVRLGSGAWVRATPR